MALAQSAHSEKGVLAADYRRGMDGQSAEHLCIADW